MIGPPFKLKCWLFGHCPSEDMRHGFCNDSDTEFTFCARCTTLFKEVDGEWVEA